jgi:hypothetical protein
MRPSYLFILMKTYTIFSCPASRSRRDQASRNTLLFPRLPSFSPPPPTARPIPLRGLLNPRMPLCPCFLFLIVCLKSATLTHGESVEKLIPQVAKITPRRSSSLVLNWRCEHSTEDWRTWLSLHCQSSAKLLLEST